MDVATFKAKCKKCQSIFVHPSLGDFAYGTFIFSTKDGKNHLVCDAAALETSVLKDFSFKKISAVQFENLLLSIVDNPFGLELTCEIPCTVCGAFELEYWEGDKVGVKSIAEATFNKFCSLSQIDKAKVIEDALHNHV